MSKPLDRHDGHMKQNWTAQLSAAWKRASIAVTRPSRYVASWDRWDVDSGTRRELNDLDAIWARFQDHR